MARGGCTSWCPGLAGPARLAGLARPGLQSARVSLGEPRGVLLRLGQREASPDCCSHFAVRSVAVGGCLAAWAATARSRRTIAFSSHAATSDEDSERLGLPLPKGSTVTVAEIKRAHRQLLAGLPREKYLFVGNHETGTRTLLNGLIGEMVFHGPRRTTCQPNQCTTGGDTFVHLAGCGRVHESPQQAAAAAAAITALLSQIGCCKVLFVLTEESGRLRPADKALMKLVLASAHIEDFGVIINKVSKGFMKMIETGNKANNRDLDPTENFKAQLWSMGHFTDLVALNPFNAELSRPAGGADSPAVPLTKELSHFIDSVPATDVRLGLLGFGDDVQQAATHWEVQLQRARDNYELLGLPAGSSRSRAANIKSISNDEDYRSVMSLRADIKRAYWAKVNEAHPWGRPPGEREAAGEELRRLTRARNHLLAALPEVDPPTKYLFLCYEGVSRPRAIVSALTGTGEEEAVERRWFGPGPGPASLAHYECKYDGDTYMALPGLADSFSRKQAIEGINRVLREGGHFKVTFVLGGDGGLSHGDATLMRLVLDSLDEGPGRRCGILCSGDCRDRQIVLQGLDIAGFSCSDDLVAFRLWGHPDLDGRPYLWAEGLSDFLETFPTLNIKEGAARDIQLDDFTKQYCAFRDHAWPIGRMLQ